MRVLLRNPVTWAIGALLLVILLASTLAIVPETKQAVIVRLEQPIFTVNVLRPGERLGHTGAGLIARFPFIDRIVWVDKRVLDLELDKQPVLSTDQQRLEVDAYARFRVVDPLLMFERAGSEQGVKDQLRPLFGSELRNELGKREFALLLSPERGELMGNIRVGLQRLARQYGVKIIDVRIRQAELPDGSPIDRALERMRTARNQQALTIRAQGQKQAQIIRADADASAARVYAQAFGRDPDFYDFYRAMQSYRKTFGADGTAPAADTNVILSPDSTYLKQFQAPGRGK